MDISVVIPIYNVEKYLRRCIDSILHQVDVIQEIILVDDGSTDTSGIICDEYADKNPEIKCLHISNSGPATAKNVGYDHATGKDIKDLIEFVKKEIKEKYDVDLKVEQEFVNWE